MTTVTINGKTVSLPEPATLNDTIVRFSPDIQRIIAELDGIIIDHTAWNTTWLKPGSRLELITFVGGG